MAKKISSVLELRIAYRIALPSDQDYIITAWLKHQDRGHKLSASWPIFQAASRAFLDEMKNSRDRSEGRAARRPEIP
jgi:hypothetical protein